MIIALASPRIASSIDDGLARVERLVADASARGAEIVCFPEAYFPGLRGQDFDVAPYDAAAEARVLRTVAGFARASKIATILGMEKVTPAGRQIAACVVRCARRDSRLPDEKPARSDRGSVLRAGRHARGSSR